MHRESIIELVYRIIKRSIIDILEVKSKNPTPLFQDYTNYPSLSYHKNGFPSISKNPYGNSNIVNYEQYFTINPSFHKDKIDLTSYPEYDELKNLVLNYDKYSEIYSPGNEDKLNLLEFSMKQSIIDLACKILLEYGEENELSKKQMMDFYQPIENRVTFRDLPFAIYIPILFTKFDIQDYNLTDSISIVEMDEIFQKSRSEIESYTEGIPEPVLMAATHALKFKNWAVPNYNYWLNHNTLGVYESYPISQIGAFFNTLRFEGILTGYAQIITNPIGWVDRYKGDLIDLKGVAIRAYPTIFNDYYWNQENFPVIDKQSLVNIQHIFKEIIEKDNKKINLACSRLENSFYRNREGDRVIDIVIGLESILSDGEKSELTHKLSLRAAFLLQYSSLEETKYDIFNNMKAIYDYRSAIVHGESQSKLDKKRYISKKEVTKTVVEVAESYLKECIKVLIQNADFLNAKNIDEKLILDYSEK